ncbi:dTDP-4-dehydrorhamnose 3,5-epimerase family protein [Amycolatopsis sp. cg5]|uniref:dTDP-4-dehydrorhamnose 3,5-epimerase family protein n=1 Tax=Amycolatopsis sp. cg5 TaxID=3238802 RepID=UPI0035264567
MKITEMTIPDAFRIVPDQIPDLRGNFYESWRQSELTAAMGRPFTVEQVNYSVSQRGTLRGIHGTTMPPGQAKVITCVRGQVLDVVVDLRIGSPTFGMYETTIQDEESGITVCIAEGLGHAFLALTDDVCMNYVCAAEYVHGTMLDIQALDPKIGIPWNLTEDPIMSEKDRAAPTLDEAVALGLLPTYEQCLAHYAAAKETSR